MTDNACESQIRAVRINPVNPDPAVDVAASDIGLYLSTRKLSHLKLLPELQDYDAVFVLDRLGPKVLAGACKYSHGLHANQQTPEQRMAAFQYGCRRIERPGREALVCLMPGEGDRNSTMRCVPSPYGMINSDAFLNAVCDEFSPEVVQEMGSIILTWSGLPKGQIGPFYFWGGHLR